MWRRETTAVSDSETLTVRDNQPTITIYIPRRYQDERVLDRLKTLANDRDRSTNYLAVQAIREYLERHDAQQPAKT